LIQPRRICIVAACPVPSPRGTPIRVTRFAEALARLGHEVHLVAYGESTGLLDPSIHVHRIRTFPFVRVEKPGPTVGKLALLDPLLALRLREVMQHHRFDLVHAHHYEGLLSSLAAGVPGRGVPLIYDAHTVLEIELPDYWALGRLLQAGRIGRLFDRWCPRRADFVVAASERLGDHLVGAGTVPENRVAAIGNGVNLDHFPAGRVAEAPDMDGGILVYAGNLAPYQGMEHLLQGFRTVLEVRPRAILRVLTTSPSDVFEARAEALGIRGHIEVRAVRFESLPEELALAHLALNPRPRCDGVPQKNLNYMAASLPLVAFAGSLHPYRHPESGLAVEEVSGAALGRAILTVLDQGNDRRVRMGAEARRALEADFTWERQALRLSEIYDRILSPHLPA
jgi:glycosyltransferase involved in cell wall biosynthesis